MITLNEIKEHILKNGWTEHQQISNHFQHPEYIGLVAFEGDLAFIVEGFAQVPWSTIRSIEQMNRDLASLNEFNQDKLKRSN